MEIVKFKLKDKNELLELDKECFGVNHWDNGLDLCFNYES